MCIFNASDIFQNFNHILWIFGFFFADYICGERKTIDCALCSCSTIKLIILLIFIYFHMIDTLLPIYYSICVQTMISSQTALCAYFIYYFNVIFAIAIKCVVICCSIHFIFYHDISFQPLSPHAGSQFERRAPGITHNLKLVSRNMD